MWNFIERQKKEIDMGSDTKETLVVAVVIAAVVVGGLMLVKAEQCAAQWGSSGMAHSWKPIQGCMIQRKDGTWIPASAYREVND